jgi:hypothetical protein
MVLTLLLCVLYGSHNKHRLLPYTILADWFLITRLGVFTTRHALNPCIKQTHYVFKGLKNVQRSKKRKKLKRAPNFSLQEWKLSETNVAEEYWWATTQAAGRSCCCWSYTSVLEFGLQLDAFVSTFVVVRIYGQFCPAQNSTCDGRQG